MSNSRKSITAKRVQYAALPYRMNDRTQPEVMLVTSRETRRWIIPKGWPHKGKAPHRSAAREAFEEAGVVGPSAVSPLGLFHTRSGSRRAGVVACEVLVFALEVKRQSKEWPEKRERKVRWLSAKVGAKTVQDRELERSYGVWHVGPRRGP